MILIDYQITVHYALMEYIELYNTKKRMCQQGLIGFAFYIYYEETAGKNS